MIVKQVQLVSIPVSDQDRAKDFYVDSLGFELVNDVQMGPDMRWVQVRPVGAVTSLTLVTWFDTMAAGSLKGTVLETDDLANAVKELRAKGVAIEGDMESQPWGQFVTFSDPDGNGIILQTTAS